MALALCPVTLRAWNRTTVGVSPPTFAFCNSVRTPEWRTSYRNAALIWRRPNDAGGLHYGTDRPVATNVSVGGHRRSAAGCGDVSARPRTVSPFLSLRLSLLDRHGPWLPGHIALAPRRRREVGH